MKSTVMATRKKVIRKNKEVPIRFIIKSISVLEFKDNIPSSIEGINIESFNYKITANISINFDETSLDIIILYKFFDDATQYEELSILNRIEILDLKKHLNSENKISDIGFLRYAVDMSITHSRGIHAHLVKDTKFNTFLIPPVPHSSIDSKIVWR